MWSGEARGHLTQFIQSLRLEKKTIEHRVERRQKMEGEEGGGEREDRNEVRERSEE